jgi:putative nucleotidyltransferase with HDIG domain
MMRAPLRVLLVDADAPALRAMARLVRHLRPDCAVAIHADGRAAIADLDAKLSDLVIADIGLPGVSGIEVLRHARARRPEAIRVAVSGFVSPPAQLAIVMKLAHRFLDKPLSTELLQEVIDRAEALYRDVPSIDDRGALIAATDLPSAPVLYARLRQVLADPDRSVTQLADLIRRDDAMSARVLQVASSALYGATFQTTNVFDAVLRVGSRTLQSLALSVGAFRSFGVSDHCAGFDIDVHEAHAFLVARIAARIVPSAQAEDAFAMALLHDIGKLVFASRRAAQFAPVLAMAAVEGKALAVVETETGFASHATAGARLLGAWGLPASLVDAVAHHHNPTLLGATAWGAPPAVHVADVLAHEVAASRGIVPASAVPMIDHALLMSLGVAGNLDAWRTIAVEESDRPLSE